MVCSRSRFLPLVLGLYIDVLLSQAGRLADEIKALRTQKSDEKVGDDAERNTKYHSLIA